MTVVAQAHHRPVVEVVTLALRVATPALVAVLRPVTPPRRWGAREPSATPPPRRRPCRTGPIWGSSG
jgi:hypothetical protein